MARSLEDRIRWANDELLGKGNLDVVAEAFAPDYVAHGGGRSYRGHAFVKRFVKELRGAMPDLRVVEVEILAKSGRTVTWQRTLRGTNTAPLKGIPASGKKVTWREMLVTRFDGTRIAEDRLVSDIVGELLAKMPRA